MAVADDPPSVSVPSLKILKDSPEGPGMNNILTWQRCRPDAV